MTGASFTVNAMAPAPHMVDTVEELTVEWFTDVLRYAGDLGSDSFVVSVHVQPFGTGQLSRIVVAELDYGPRGDGPRSVVVKLPSADARARSVAVALGAYEAEVGFYREFAPRLDLSVPRALFADFDPSGRLTLVLEHLDANWECGDAVLGGDVAQARAAVDQLVALQAASWTRHMPARSDWLTSAERTQQMFEHIPRAIVPFRRRFGHRLQPQHLELVEKLAPQAPGYPALAWRPPFVLAHCDFRVDNLLFTSDTDGLRAAVIDWQLLRMGPPLIDVCIFLASSLHSTTRRTHQDELLSRYHNGLTERGVSRFTFDDCLENLRVCALYPLLASIIGAVSVEQTERGDEMIANTVAQAADLIIDWDAEEVLR